MDTDRIRLNEEFRSRLFDNILLKKNINLKQLSIEINCGYTALKKWRAGTSLMPRSFLKIFVNLADSNFNENLSVNILEELPKNWGAKLGGERYFGKYKKEIKSRMKHIREFKLSLPMPKIDNQIWELVGVCLGDGCISKYYSNYDCVWIYETIFTGNMVDDLKYYDNFLLPLLKNKFKVQPKPYLREESHVIVVKIRSKRIFNFFKSLGVPVGKKVKKIRVTRAMKSSDDVKAAILRGLLDTDGHIFARKDENYKYPYLKISSGSNKFLKDLKTMIRSFGLPAYIHGGDVQIRGGKNLRIWMEKIGSSHPTHINRYNAWISTGKLFPKRGPIV